MFRIHAAPRSLLAMFGMKQEGRNPPDMPETVQCTADVLDNYLNQFFGRTSSGVQTVTAGTLVSQVTVTLPNGFMWRVWGVAGLSIVAAGDAAVDGFYTTELITQAGDVMPLSNFTNVSASLQARRWAFWFPAPIIVRAGVNFRSTANMGSATASDYSHETVIYSQAVPE